jgi:hypothetical protein
MIKLVTRITLFLFIFAFFSCDGRKEIPFELANNRIILNANVNGTSGRFMWDTGAQISIVSYSTTRQSSAKPRVVCTPSTS